MRGGGRDGAAIGGGVGAASLDADTSPARGRRQVPIGSQPAGPQAAAGAGRGRSPRSAAPAWRRPRPGPNDADLRRFALCVGRRDTSSAERRQPGTRRVEGLAARHRIHRSRSARAAWHSRTEVTTPCMSASFIPCLPSAVARAPETPVALRLLPPMQTGGAPRSARIPFEGDILTNTDFCSSTTDCTDPFADRGNPEVVAPDQLSRHTARARTRSRCGRARPDGLLPTDSSARSGNPRRNV